MLVSKQQLLFEKALRAKLKCVLDPRVKNKVVKSRTVLTRLGSLKLNRVSGAFDVTTKDGAILRLYPNSEERIEKGVHIDEIEVPEAKQGRGMATAALAALCKLADEYGFALDGGPVGFSDNPYRDRFVVWLRRFGFERDTSGRLPRPHDINAFYVRRAPKGPFRSVS